MLPARDLGNEISIWGRRMGSLYMFIPVVLNTRLLTFCRINGHVVVRRCVRSRFNWQESVCILCSEVFASTCW
jgi:hypothetical protein